MPGIDLRGNGGYIVAPPSLHISGVRYEWFDLAGGAVEVEDPNGRDKGDERDARPDDEAFRCGIHSHTLPRSIAPALEWLREQPRRPTVIEPPRFQDADGTPQGKAALQRQLDILSRARQGERNHTLNRCAFIVGLFIRPGHLDQTTARRALTDTALTPWETTRTLDSALGAF